MIDQVSNWSCYDMRSEEVTPKMISKYFSTKNCFAVICLSYVAENTRCAKMIELTLSTGMSFEE